jgi:hypothetical protein
MSILPKELIDSLEEGSTLWEVAVGEDGCYKLIDYHILSNGHYLALEFDQESKTTNWFHRCILCIYTSFGSYVKCTTVVNSDALEKSIESLTDSYFDLSSVIFTEILLDEEVLERFRKKIFAANFR